MKRTLTFIVIFNLLFSIMGVAQYAHYCCDATFETYFTAPSCNCEEMACEDEDCCKDEVKVMQLMQDGISSERSEVAKPIFKATFFYTYTTDLHNALSCATAPSFLSGINEVYESPPIYLKNRSILI